MQSILRVAGFAAAAVGAASSPALADPFQAFDLGAVQVQAPASADVESPIAQPARPQAEEAPKQADTPLSTSNPEPAVAPVEVDKPAFEGKRSLLSLVDEYASDRVSGAELECLAGAIYFEAKGEPLAGQLAVAEVIINRSKSGRYPTSLCGVVKQRGQFSFIRAGQFPPIAKQSAHWRKAVAIAHIASKDLADSPAENALAFHATYVSPRWRMKRVATVGNHIFYR